VPRFILPGALWCSGHIRSLHDSDSHARWVVLGTDRFESEGEVFRVTIDDGVYR
jgi:hypothetical protein